MVIWVDILSQLQGYGVRCQVFWGVRTVTSGDVSSSAISLRACLVMEKAQFRSHFGNGGCDSFSSVPAAAAEKFVDAE